LSAAPSRQFSYPLPFRGQMLWGERR
jgi:hypothetical protein